MELRDYIAALRRHWRIWTGATLLGLLLAAAFLQLTPPSYAATAQVFVTSTVEGPESAQFVNQRVKSYPQVATSDAVLRPVIARLGLDSTSRQLREDVSAANPVDTSQIDITVTGPDADDVADIANAVAAEFRRVVEDLERPQVGGSPVKLTVTDPATVPTAPSSPLPMYVYVLGGVVGVLVGVAAAVARSALTTAVYDEADIRAAWGSDVEVLTRPSGRARHSVLAGRPSLVLARRLEVLGEGRPARFCFLSPAPGQKGVVRHLVDEVADHLRHRRSHARVEEVTGAHAGLLTGSTPTSDTPETILVVGDPLSSLRTWRHLRETCDGIVVVVRSGRVDAAELTEIQSLLATVSFPLLAVVLLPRRSQGRRVPRSWQLARAPRALPSAEAP